ncbi:MAG: tetratricopeptide repeat protein [Bacteroidetes bacterium]|nr:tetratricopeptide repeat protein [Bacteroidota bacterium]
MGKPHVTVVLLLLLIPGFSGAQEREPAEQVKSLMESCQFSQAVGLAELFLSRDSTRTDLMLLKGRALAAGYQYREAIGVLLQAQRLDTANIKILNELADVYRQSGDPATAIAICRKVCTLAPGNRYFSLQLASLLYSEENYRQALKVLLPVYMSDSSSFFVAKQLGNCYNELKRSDSAIRFYRRALRIIPFDPYVTGKLVNIFIREDEIAMALYHAQVYLARDSVNIPILKQSGYCNYLLIDFKSAAKQFLECAKLGDSSKFTMKYLGLSYYKQEKYDTALPFFRSAFHLDTTDAEVCFYYGVSAYRSLAVDTGLVYLNSTLRLLMPPGKFLSTLYSELADANTSKGNADTAVFFLQKALEANPQNNNLRFKIAYQYDFHLRMPYDGLPYYREFLKNADPGGQAVANVPQQVSYSDYARKRISEIAGAKKKK